MSPLSLHIAFQSYEDEGDLQGLFDFSEAFVQGDKGGDRTLAAIQQLFVRGYYEQSQKLFHQLPSEVKQTRSSSILQMRIWVMLGQLENAYLAVSGSWSTDPYFHDILIELSLNFEEEEKIRNRVDEINWEYVSGETLWKIAFYCVDHHAGELASSVINVVGDNVLSVSLQQAFEVASGNKPNVNGQQFADHERVSLARIYLFLWRGFTAYSIPLS